MAPNLHTHDGVNNLRGTGGYVCACTSWRLHWEAASGQSFPRKCSNVFCIKPAYDGAHVQKVDMRSRGDWWIVPFCRSCNLNYEETIWIPKGLLVSANRALMGCYRAP